MITSVFVISGPLARTDLAGVFGRFCAGLARSRAPIILCDVEGVDADAVAVDALARIQLAARRYGCQVRLLGASAEMRRLVTFMGLRDVLPAQSRQRRPVSRGGVAGRTAGRCAPCRGKR